MWQSVLAFLSLCCIQVVCSDVLAPRMKPLPVGSVTPSGWLLQQLVIQAEGLSGHLADFWPDVMHSSWIGGSKDGGLHERTPYWLNGIVPLSFLLENAGKADSLKHKQRGQVLNITAQVEKYVGYILDHQSYIGWLGPEPSSVDGNAYWGPSYTLLALTQYADAMRLKGRTDLFDKATKAVLRHILCQKDLMEMVPPAGWAKARWQSVALAAQWLLDNAPQGHTDDLLDAIAKLHETGYDWEEAFDSNLTSTDFFLTHNVNIAQALKTSAVLYRYNSSYTYNNKSLETLSVERMRKLDDVYGLPTGMFNGDEHLPTPPTRSPSRGIELCGVVEAMYSYNTLYSVFYDHIEFADRAERIAYNALPATWASPRGGDMWAHQYLQAVNEINAINANSHIWQTDGPLSETYGLQPNYGCCTANFNQGWPKFASNLFFTGIKREVVVGMYAPASAQFPDGHNITVDTQYPFADNITVTIFPNSEVDIWLRIPSWATNAKVNGVSATAGKYFKDTVLSKTTYTIELNPSIRVEEWDNGAVSVHRGALMFSLPIQPTYEIYGSHYLNESNDYYLYPSSDWGFALDISKGTPNTSLSFVSTGYVQGSAPFNHTGWPCWITATARGVEWGISKNSATNPPESPVCGGDRTKCGPPMGVKLVPHGGTELRIGEFPTTGLDEYS